MTMIKRYSVDATISFWNPPKQLVKLWEFGIADLSVRHYDFGGYPIGTQEVNDEYIWIDIVWDVDADNEDDAATIVEEKLKGCNQFPKFLTLDYSEVTGVYNETTGQWEIS
jgi:hypothetical protein